MEHGARLPSPRKYSRPARNSPGRKAGLPQTLVFEERQRSIPISPSGGASFREELRPETSIVVQECRYNASDQISRAHPAALWSKPKFIRNQKYSTSVAEHHQSRAGSIGDPPIDLMP